MKLKLLQENLSQAVTHLQKALSNRPQLPILSSVLIETTESTCTISATDLYFGVRCTLTSDTQTVGSCAVPGKQFKEIIGSLNPGALTLNLTQNNLQIQTQQVKTSLTCSSFEDFPPFPQVEGEEYVFSLEDLEKIEQYILFSTSVDQARPVLTGVLFEFNEDVLTVVSTDGFRLSTFAMKNPTKHVQATFLLQAKSLLEVLRIAHKIGVTEIAFRVSHELKQVFFSLQGIEVFVRLIDGAYPPYQKIIPASFTTQVYFDGQEMIEHLKRAQIFARESSNIIRFIITKDHIEVLASSPALGTYSGLVEQVQVTSDAEQKEIAFNSKYVLEYLSSVKAERHFFGMNESLKPALFRPENLSEYTHVVMPFKVNG